MDAQQGLSKPQTAPFRRSKQSRWLRGIIVSLALLVIMPVAMLKVSGCMSVGPKSDKKLIAALTRQSVELEAGRLSFLTSLNERLPRVIYVHGTPNDAKAFADFLVDPVDGLEAISVDRPGFGNSQPSGAMVSYEDQARAIRSLLVERAGKWPILVGHSLGGPIVARVAADYPEQVAGIVIVAGNFDPEEEKVGILQSIVQTRVARFFMPQMFDNSLMELREGKSQTTKLATVLGKIRCPVIIVHGTADTLVVYSNVEYLRSRLTSAKSIEVVTLDDQSHFIPWQRPDTIRYAVKKLRDSLEVTR